MENFERDIAEILEVVKVNPEDELLCFENWDSLSVLCIIGLAEQKGAKINNKEVIEAKTIGGLKKLFNERI